MDFLDFHKVELNDPINIGFRVAFVYLSGLLMNKISCSTCVYEKFGSINFENKDNQV